MIGTRSRHRKNNKVIKYIEEEVVIIYRKEDEVIISNTKQNKVIGSKKRKQGVKQYLASLKNAKFY